MTFFVGREHELSILREALTSHNPDLIALFGRRRVGKTFLIRHAYEGKILFELTGIKNASLRDQLENFHIKLSAKLKDSQKPKRPDSWFKAFAQLEKYIESNISSSRKVVFFDEFPWLDNPRSKFLMAFESFWNSYATKRSDLTIVICGSAASYMVNKIIKSKGGLHNRITQRLRLLPFTLKETESFFKKKGLKYNRYDILKLYMALGGIPFHLSKLRKGESVAQAINRICFQKDSPLADEFELIFASLFNKHEKHVTIIRALAENRRGITRDMLSKKSGIGTGGGLTRTLDELIESGFVSIYRAFGRKTKASLYRLSDEYSLFYLKFIENNISGGQGGWQRLALSNSYMSWCGYSFESICLKHVHQLKLALNISGIYSVNSSWNYRSSEGGVQVDLLIDRDDNIINLCEIKYSSNYFTINKAYATELRNKLSMFKSVTKTRKNIFITMITTYGLKENSYSLELISINLTMDALFN